MKGAISGYIGPYSGCWTDKECPHCGNDDGVKSYDGRISS